MSDNKRELPGGEIPVRTWYQTNLGQQLASSELALVEAQLPNLFGYHLLQLGAVGHESLLRGSRIRHQLVIESDYSFRKDDIGLYAKPHQLPIATDSIDALLLPHTLEFSEDPHQVLREVERVLIPEGHVLILGFNPLSFWGLRKLFGFSHRERLWRGKYVSMVRIKDWLSLLGFDAVECRYSFYRPPIQWAGLLGKLAFLESVGRRLWPILGGVYLVVAKKRVTTFTPIRAKWRTPHLVGVRVRTAESQTRNS